MSDDEGEIEFEHTDDPFARYHGLDADDAVAFFRDVAPDAKCPVCGHEDLRIHSGVGLDADGNSTVAAGSFALAGHVMHEIPSRGTQMKQAVVTTSCTRCGYLMNFLAETMLEWKQANDREESS